jgi:hypothetical protein
MADTVAPQAAPVRKGRGPIAAAVLLLTLICGALRLACIDSGLPQSVENDLKFPDSVEVLRAERAGLSHEVEQQWYPLLVPRLAALWPQSADPPPEAPLERHLSKAAEPVLQVRWTVALLGALIVPLTYLLARTTLGRPAAWVAAGLAGFSLLHVTFSQQGRPHGVAAVTFLCAVLGCIQVRRRGDSAAWLLAGLGCAAAIGTLQSSVLVLPALGLAWLLRARAGGRWLEPRALIALALMAVSLPWFFPGMLADGAGVGAGASTLNLSGHLLFLDQFRGEGLRTVVRTGLSFDPWLSALALVGSVLALGALRRPAGARGTNRSATRDEVWVALAFALPYLLVIVLYRRTYERFCVPLVPYMAWAAAYAVQRGLELAGGRGERTRALRFGLMTLSLAVPACCCLAWSRARAGEHTTTSAARWLEQNVPDPSTPVLLTPLLDLPLPRMPEGLVFGNMSIYKVSNVPWSRYQYRRGSAALPGPLWNLSWMRTDTLAGMDSFVAEPWKFLRESGARLAVIEVFEGRPPRAAGLVRAALRREAKRVARFSPDGRADRSEHPLDPQEATIPSPPWFLPRVLRARATGPVIEVYDLTSAPAERDESEH